MAGNLSGRVGDAQSIVCATYAATAGAATVTGFGESITLGRRVVANMEAGQDAQAAAERALREITNTVGGQGGVIAIDQNGVFGMEMQYSTDGLGKNTKQHVGICLGTERRCERGAPISTKRNLRKLP